MLSAYVVTTTADGGAGSLRDAINQINADTNHTLYTSPGNPNVDEIDFNITALSDIAGGGTGYNAITGVATIQPQRLNGALPAITNSVLINGYTQGQGTPLAASMNTLLGPSALGSTDSTLHPENYGDNAVLKVELDGENAGTTTGLTLSADNVTVQGLAINRFADDGILVDGNSEVIQGNFLGTDVTGTQGLGNRTADVYVHDSVNDTIGGTTPAARNIISGALPDASGNFGDGINLVGGHQVVVQGNFIGTDVTGMKSLGNASHGIASAYGDHNLIGGPVTGAGNVISGNGGGGILEQGSPNVYEGNFIGTDVTGTKSLGNGSYGIYIQSSGGSETVGAPAAGNLISGNVGAGILGSGDKNVIQGNFIGTDVTGKAALGNHNPSNGSGYGILIETNSDNNTIGVDDTIGGPTAGEFNIISANDAGLVVDGSGNKIKGNFIGTDVTGTQAIGNLGSAVGLANGATGNTIGGTTAVDRNIISGNGHWGIEIGDASGGTGVNLPSNNLVEGNYIGTDATGSEALGNGGGVELHGALNNTIGGTAQGAGNVISGTGFGVQFYSNNGPNDPNSGNVVQGNLIGTDYTGTKALGNLVGVQFLDILDTNNLIGGTASGAGNVIAASSGFGVDVEEATNNMVEGNWIGTNSRGTPGLGNGAGVQLRYGATGNTLLGNAIVDNNGNGVSVYYSNNTVGGAAAGAGNNISGNSGDGVFVTNGATGVSILGNSISASGDLGIHLDSATNANNNQAAPVLTSANSSSSGTTISGTLTSVANTTFRVEFFANQSPNPSGYGEGLTFLGFANVTTDASGHASFTATGLAPVPAGQGWLSATATDPGGNTSQFSRDLEYNFSGFLPPLSQLQSYSVNRNIPIKFQLTDVFGNTVTSLGAVTALQIFNSQGVDILGGSGASGLSVSGSTYSYSWHTKGLAAGSYTISVTLADHSTHTITIQLTASGSGSNAQATDGSDVSGGSAAGQLLGGNVNLYVDNSSADLTSDELARIQDAVSSVDATIAPYGVAIDEVTDPTQADVTLNMGTTSAVGGYAQGILGCYNTTGAITLIQGWNWYAGSDPTQIGSNQYDFQTTVTHELGHALGLGESSVKTSAMYGTLAPATTIRTLTTADLNIPYAEAGADAQRAGLPPANTMAASNSVASMPSSGSASSGMGQLYAEFSGFVSFARNAYQAELSALSALWQQADALALQRLDALLSMELGAMGVSKDTLMRNLFLASNSSANGE